MLPHDFDRTERLRVAVAGGGRCDEETHRRALEVGRRIAEAGALLLCGGGSGVMAAAAEGARHADGLVIGVLPGIDRHASPPNRFVDLPIYTGLGQARNLILVLTADVVIAIGGEWGTLSEIALARKHGRPVVLLGSWRLRAPESESGSEGAIEMPPAVATAAEAVDRALVLAKRRETPE
ncbi:MAG: TIGR00725 family protein [Thermoanaerobaculia bacterium]|nr:TIGR00725 family protein [Thermoanaerobaculia bacterium]